MSSTNALAPLTSSSRARIDALFLRMNHREIPWVVKLVRLSEPRPIRLLADVTNQVCNGWIYAPLALWVIVLHEWKLLFALAMGVSVAHLLYGSTKPRIARERPFHFATDIPYRGRCLDQYSFPSGHCMTLSVVGLLLCWRHHAAIPELVFGLLLLCWARVASGQHYPSDLVAGIGVGSFVATSLALCLF